MKKSDLTRRAERDAKRAYKTAALYMPEHAEAHAYGFESGYRAARADLRQSINRERKNFDPQGASGSYVGVVQKWLRPIR